MTAFIIVDAAGNVLRVGYCQPSTLEYQADKQAGQFAIAIEGPAPTSCETHQWDWSSEQLVAVAAGD